MPTLAVLALLKNKGLLPEKTVAELTEAYVYLRHLEHRLMYVEDAQTQELPKSDEARARIAKAMNFAQKENFGWHEFITQLNVYRSQVQQHFDETFSDANISADQLETEKSIWNGLLATQEAEFALQQLSFSNAKETLRRINTLHQSSRYCQLPELSRLRFDALMPLAISQAAEMPNADTTLSVSYTHLDVYKRQQDQTHLCLIQYKVLIK